MWHGQFVNPIYFGQNVVPFTSFTQNDGNFPSYSSIIVIIALNAPASIQGKSSFKFNTDDQSERRGLFDIKLIIMIKEKKAKSIKELKSN